MEHCINHPDELRPFLPALRAAASMGVAVLSGAADEEVDVCSAIFLAAENMPALRIDCRRCLPHGAEVLREAFSTPAVKVFQDAARDLRFLAAIGISPHPLFDVSLAGRLLAISGTDAAPATGADDEAVEAQELPRRRQHLLGPIMNAGLATVAGIEFQCARAVAFMETGGIFLNLDAWKRLTKTVSQEKTQALRALAPWLDGAAAQMTLWGDAASGGHALDSNAFVLKLLRRNGIDVRDTARRTLLPFREQPLVAALLIYRKAAKSLSSFLRPFPAMVRADTGRLHPQYDQLVAFSGRMSCRRPNIQQIPRDDAFRECFSAPPGRRLIIADYSQIELRVAAQISGDKRMLAAYRAGEDLHLLTASHLAGKPMSLISKRERQAYKAVNLGLIYGMGAAGLRETALHSYNVDMPMDQAVLFRKRFFETYRGIDEWHRRIKRSQAAEGRTLTGRRFPFQPEAGLPERSNLPVQGTAADIIKKALGLLAHKLFADRPPGGAAIVAAVHDEILLECPEADAEKTAELLQSCMEEAANGILPDVPTPVQAVISSCWAEK